MNKVISALKETGFAIIDQNTSMIKTYSELKKLYKLTDNVIDDMRLQFGVPFTNKGINFIGRWSNQWQTYIVYRTGV